MSQDPSRSLSDTFAALAQSPSRRLGPWPYLPFVVTILVAALLAALIAAMVIEDRQLQREALQRDADSTAQQLSARLVLVREALAVIAVEMSTGTVDARRFETLASEMIDSKPELIALAHLDRHGRALSPATLNFAFGPGWDPASLPEIQALAGQAVAAASTRFALLGQPRGDTAPVALLIPATAGDQPQSLLVALLSLRELLRTAVTAEMLERYRFTLEQDGRQLVASSAVVPPAGAPAYATTLAALPRELKLNASAFRRQAVFPADALAWVAGVLALAVAAALGALALYTTRLHRIDRALLAETALRRAMENSQATGLAVLDPQGVIRYVNRALTQLTGLAADALVGRGAPFPFWLPEANLANQRALRQILAGEAPAGGVEMSLQTAGGVRIEAHVYVSPLVDEDGRQIGWMTSLTDVTEPRRIRTELAAAHERFVRVLESLEAAVSVVSAERGQAATPALLFGNRAYSETFGAGADGHDRLQQALRGRDSGEVHDQASDRWFDVRTREIRWPARDDGLAGDAARLQIATDITLRKTAEEIARQQQDKVQFTARLMTMGEMASSLAHELNQPLTAINNYSEGTLARLARGAMSADELKAALAKTAAQAQRAGGIIRRIREFVKRSEPRRRPTPAARIVEDAIAFAEIEAAKRRIAIVADVDPRLPPVDADPILIEQVLLNLLKNAVESMEQAVVPRIDVRVRRAGESTAEFTVIDRGAGIAPEHLPNVFAPFFSTKSDGMGMGLNICRSIIEFHQGQLAVEPNPEPAGGTVMHFTLPLAASEPAADGAALTMEIPHR
ncbi:MAG: PAS domain S-box protein [Burkholderiales bacterium]|nr:PAS domain S-box protein [Burkholderiales bacterium]